MRHSRFATMAQLQRIAWSKTVRCRYEPCSQPVGEQCVNTSSTASKGAPLGGLGAHLVRLEDAEAAVYPTLPLQTGGSSPSTSRPVASRVPALT